MVSGRSAGIMQEVDPVWMRDRLNPIDRANMIAEAQRPPTEQANLLEVGRRVTAADLAAVTPGDIEALGNVSADEFRWAMIAMQRQNMYEATLMAARDDSFLAAARKSVRTYVQVAAEGLRDNSSWFLSVLRGVTDDHRCMCAQVNADKAASDSGVW